MKILYLHKNNLYESNNTSFHYKSNIEIFGTYHIFPNNILDNTINIYNDPNNEIDNFFKVLRSETLRNSFIQYIVTNDIKTLTDPYLINSIKTYKALLDDYTNYCKIKKYTPKNFIKFKFSRDILNISDPDIYIQNLDNILNRLKEYQIHSSNTDKLYDKTKSYQAIYSINISKLSQCYDIQNVIEIIETIQCNNILELCFDKENDQTLNYFLKRYTFSNLINNVCKNDDSKNNIKLTKNSKTLKSCINWYGGKYYLSNSIISIFPTHNQYVEVFGGAGHILVKKKLVKENIYNDKNEGLTNFFNILKSPSKANILKNMLELTPYHECEWTNCKNWSLEVDKIERARMFYTFTMMSRSGNGGWSYTLNTDYIRNGISASVSKWIGNIETNLISTSKKLRKIKIYNKDFRRIIPKYDLSNTLIYLDPPYIPDSRTYKNGYTHEMSYKDHIDLLKLLLSNITSANIVLSGFDDAKHTYALLEYNGWKRYLIDEVVKSSVNINRMNHLAKEYVWINYNLPSEIEMQFIIREYFIPFDKINLSDTNIIIKEEHLKYITNFKNKISENKCNQLNDIIKTLKTDDKSYKNFLNKYLSGGIFYNSINNNYFIVFDASIYEQYSPFFGISYDNTFLSFQDISDNVKCYLSLNDFTKYVYNTFTTIRLNSYLEKEAH